MTVFQLAKQIRRKNEPWQKAIQRARLRYHQNKMTGGQPTLADRARRTQIAERAMGAARGAAREVARAAGEVAVPIASAAMAGMGAATAAAAAAAAAATAAAAARAREVQATLSPLAAAALTAAGSQQADRVEQLSGEGRDQYQLETLGLGRDPGDDRLTQIIELVDAKLKECHHVEDDLRLQIEWIMDWIINQTASNFGGNSPMPEGNGIPSSVIHFAELYGKIKKGYTTPAAAVMQYLDPETVRVVF